MRLKNQILLVESHYRSRTWAAALTEIATVNIVSVMPEERKLFLTSGVSQDAILDLSKFDCNKFDPSIAEQAVTRYERIYNFNANNVTSMDRTLRRKSVAYVKSYVYFVISSVERFIEEREIAIVFAEPTWLHEILICRVCEHLGIPLWAPVKSKLLADHFFFFKGYDNYEFFKRPERSALISAGSQAIDNLQKNVKPQYFSVFNRRNKITLSKLQVLLDIARLALLRYNNPNIQPSVAYIVKDKILAIIRSALIPVFIRFHRLSEVSQPYILVTLHVQPEASIDVVGSRYSDQLAFVKNIVKTTPAHLRVVVKEHPHSFGQRPVYFYKRLLESPCIILLSPWEDGRDAIASAELVISNTGTSSLEASLMGVPAVTATKMYFHQLMLSPSFDPNSDSVSDLLVKSKYWRDCGALNERRQLFDSLKRNLFEGNTGDFKTDPSVLRLENVKKLRLAFQEVISYSGL